MVYTRRNANPYVPSASERNLDAKNVDVKQTLTVSNVSAMSLAVLGNMQVKCVDGTPTATSATVAGLIVVDKTSGIKVTIDKTTGEQTAEADQTEGAKAALDATNAVTTDKAAAVSAIGALPGTGDYATGRDAVGNDVNGAGNLAAAKIAANAKYLELKQTSDIKFKWV